MRHFIYKLSKMNKRDLIGCEVGVYKGDHASMMINHLDLKRLHLVDAYPTDKTPMLEALINLENKSVFWHVQYSIDAAKNFDDNYFDFVYIDADHAYQSVKTDLEAWYPKVKKGGFLAGHDWTMQDDVGRAVREFVEEHKISTLKYEDDEREGGNEDWYFQK